jgi:hypothetical protein
MTAPAREVVVTITGFDVACHACTTVCHVPTGQLEAWVAAHRQPVVTAIYARRGDGPKTLWKCTHPRSLR